jgi:type IV secretion system protein TrbG
MEAILYHTNLKSAAAFFALAAVVSLTALSGCRTVNFDKETFTAEKNGKESGIKSIKDEQAADEKKAEDCRVQNDLKEVDVQKTVVYVKQPVYEPAEEQRETGAKGKDAVKAANAEAVQEPEKFVHGTMYYDYDSDFVYEVYTQPYRLTDIELEPGEQVLELPYLSENKVWVLGAGVSRLGEKDVQHFFLKPTYSGLITSMVIITDKRVYHLLLKSYKDTYMPSVKFSYPDSMPFTVKTDAMKSQVNKLTQDTEGVDPKYLSFDYRMSYSIFKKPSWIPTLVYDDGKRTYIRMNEIVLHRASPAVFDENNNLINYRVDKNLVIIDQLIDKVTLRYGKEKVVIRKKNYKAEKTAYVPDDTANQKTSAGQSGGLVIGDTQAEYIRTENIRKQDMSKKDDSGTTASEGGTK